MHTHGVSSIQPLVERIRLLRMTCADHVSDWCSYKGLAKSCWLISCTVTFRHGSDPFYPSCRHRIFCEPRLGRRRHSTFNIIQAAGGLNPILSQARNTPIGTDLKICTDTNFQGNCDDIFVEHDTCTRFPSDYVNDVSSIASPGPWACTLYL